MDWDSIAHTQCCTSEMNSTIWKQDSGSTLTPEKPCIAPSGSETWCQDSYYASLQAWGNGLRNYLSDVPALFRAGQQGLAALERQAGGTVVVNEIGSAPLAQHGPAINFWPDVFVIGPSNVTRVAY